MVRFGAAAMLALAAFVMTGPTPADAFLRALLRPVVQSIALSVRRGQEYERLEAQRDERIADVEVRSGIPDWQAAHGWIDPATQAREQERYTAWEQGISDQTEKEKQITRAVYGRRIGRAWREAAVGAIGNISGIDPGVRSFLQGVVNGDDVMTSALGALQETIGEGGTASDIGAARDRIGELRGQWEQAQAVLRGLRDPSTLPIQARLTALIQEASGLEDGSVEAPEAIQRIQDRAAEVRASVEEVRATISDLLVSGFRVRPERFTNNPEWRELDAHIRELSGTTAGQAILSSGARLAQERIAARLREQGIEVTDRELQQMAADAASDFISQRIAATAAGRPGSSVVVGDVVQAAIDRFVAEREGMRPIDRPTPEPTAVPATASPPPTATPAPQPGFRVWRVTNYASGAEAGFILVGSENLDQDPPRLATLPGGGIGETLQVLVPVTEVFPTALEAQQSVCGSISGYRRPPLASFILQAIFGGSIVGISDSFRSVCPQ
jgi:hypothetical protein